MGDLIIYGGIAFVAWVLWPVVVPPIVVEPPKGGQPVKPADVFLPLLANKPTPGRFYRITGTSPDAAGNQGLLAQALNAKSPGAGSKIALRLAYLDEMTKGWNARYFSRNQPTDTWPAMYNFRGINIGPAWLPRNADAIADIAAGRLPLRTITEAGAATGQGSSHGLLWLPDIDAAALAGGAVVVVQHEDGTDPAEPPKVLTDLLV